MWSRPLLGALCLVSGACAGSVPLPEVGDHKEDLPVVVPYPPPPQKVELTPTEPGPTGAVWIDGEWLWRAGRWEWKQGRWEVPESDSTYAPPAVDYLPGGKITWYAGRWHKIIK